MTWADDVDCRSRSCETRCWQVRFPVRYHWQPEGPFFALRLEVEGRIIAYTGDTEWTEALLAAARNADLLIAETYFRRKQVPLHLDLATLERHLPAIGAKRVLLTHMSDDMLAQRNSTALEAAEDGLVVHF